MDSHFDKTFNQAAAKVAALSSNVRVDKEVPHVELSAADLILQADQDNDYFRMFNLPRPTLDPLGRPVWNVPASDVSRAYRKLAIIVHPDKNPTESARKAFEALNKAQLVLTNKESLEGLLSGYVEEAKARQERGRAHTTIVQRASAASREQDAAKQMRQEESRMLQEQIIAEMQRRKTKISSKRPLEEDDEATFIKQYELLDENPGAQRIDRDEDDDNDERRRRRQALSKRRRRRVINNSNS